MMTHARSEAEAILLDANRQATDTKAKADKWATEIRTGATEFVESIMRNSDEVLSSNIAEIRKARQSLFGDNR
jgi:vacuolar-type H+-ATPase subunit E/Vma4